MRALNFLAVAGRIESDQGNLVAASGWHRYGRAGSTGCSLSPLSWIKGKLHITLRRELSLLFELSDFTVAKL